MSQSTPVERSIGPVAARAMASVGVITPTPCSRSRQIGWPVISVSYSSSRGGISSSSAQHVVAPARRQVGGDATGADVVVVHPQAGDLLEEAQHLLALAPAVDHHRHGAEVHAVGREEQQVAGHPVELGHQHADPHRPLGDLLVDAEQLLGGEGERQLVEERAEVVHARDVRAALHVRQRLAGLLHPGVQVADDRLAAQHRLALQLEHQAQHAVGAGVRRAHVEDHRLVLVRIVRDVAELGRLGLAHAQHGADLAQQLPARQPLDCAALSSCDSSRSTVRRCQSVVRPGS